MCVSGKTVLCCKKVGGLQASQHVLGLRIGIGTEKEELRFLNLAIWCLLLSGKERQLQTN